MKPNTPMLAISTRLITRSPAAIRRNHLPINSAAQRCAALLGFTQCVQPNLPGLSPQFSFTHPPATEFNFKGVSEPFTFVWRISNAKSADIASMHPAQCPAVIAPYETVKGVGAPRFFMAPLKGSVIHQIKRSYNCQKIRSERSDRFGEYLFYLVLLKFRPTGGIRDVAKKCAPDSQGIG